MKKQIFSLLLFLMFSINPVLAEEQDNQSIQNYDQLYESLPIIDIHYENNEDPRELEDYNKYYLRSPYPLIKLSHVLEYKAGELKPGLFLLTPRYENGYNFVIFKQNGKVVAFVPVFEKETINPELAYPKPKENIKWYKLPFVKTKRGVDYVFKPIRRPPPNPKFKLKGKLVQGKKYYVMDLFYDKYSYKMLFRVQRKDKYPDPHFQVPDYLVKPEVELLNEPEQE